jgi:hypothetical protein
MDWFEKYQVINYNLEIAYGEWAEEFRRVAQRRLRPGFGLPAVKMH